MSILPIRPLMKMTTTDPFGKIRTTKDGKDYPHPGEDLRAEIGTPVAAILDGVVMRASFRPPKKEGGSSYGYVIVIYHGDSAKKNDEIGRHTYSLYAHLSKIYAKVDQTVTSGQLIGLTGDTEKVDPHLHLEVMESPYKIKWVKTGRDMGNYIYGVHSKDPMKFLKERFIKHLEPLTDAESAIVHSMVDWEFKRGPRPTFVVKAPEFSEIMNKIRPGTDIAGIKPPIFTLEFQNFFSKEFKKQHPSVALNVNGRTIDRIRPGTKNYDLRIWE